MIEYLGFGLLIIIGIIVSIISVYWLKVEDEKIHAIIALCMGILIVVLSFYVLPTGVLK